MSYTHIPAMPDEVIHYLNVRPGKIYVDGTLGGGGHSKAICEKILPEGILTEPEGRLIGIDQDIDAIKNAKQVLVSYLPNIHLFHDNYVHLDQILESLNLDGVDGILLDLGLSLHHLVSSSRGFSFKKKEPLDMRMNIQSDITAEKLVNEMKEETLARIFKELGEEHQSRQIAKKISTARKHTRIKYSRQLAQIVLEALPPARRYGQKIHPATKVFMALRIAVNKELETLTDFMDNVPDYLNPGGRLCVLSYHSLEDRIVKNKIREFEKECTCPPEFPTCVCNKRSLMRVLTRKVVRPSAEEIKKNPMSRSTKLRAAEKL